MNPVFALIENGLAIDFGIVILICLGFGSLIFYGIDFKIGNIMLLVTSTCSFMLAYANGWNYAPALIVMFLSIILMAFSLLAIGKVTSTGGVI